MTSRTFLVGIDDMQEVVCGSVLFIVFLIVFLVRSVARHGMARQAFEAACESIETGMIYIGQWWLNHIHSKEWRSATLSKMGILVIGSTARSRLIIHIHLCRFYCRCHRNPLHAFHRVRGGWFDYRLASPSHSTHSVYTYRCTARHGVAIIFVVDITPMMSHPSIVLETFPTQA